MTVNSLGWKEALAAVRVARSCASPNKGFQTQLQEFETTQLQQFREWLKEEYKENPFNDEEDICVLLAQIPSTSTLENDLQDRMVDS
ncbi:dual specificity protein phosphatase 22-B-like [Myxocyprinus asiaticus]|uniref:dual specificity protein phosphatase 22-B-like n=1 Tax=Myxocyprinus asiaticus TaxID=70543 RepID=UPI002221995E|nr:dual specificity protein phosphatase 22-B-like [Myxocyprinus asiaticus]